MSLGWRPKSRLPSESQFAARSRDDAYQLGLWKQENFLVHDAFSCDYLIVLCASF
jgi:hypothetical protein